VSLRRALIVAVAALAAACGAPPTAYAVHFAAAERAETAGRHGEAARAFDAASRDRASPRERQHAAYLAALEMIRAGDAADGAKRLQAVARARGEHAAEARWQLVLLDLATGSPDAKRELDDLLRTFPNDGVAYPALRARLRMARDAGGEAEVLSVLRALEPAVARTESAPRVAYEIAESLAKLGRLAEARDAFASVAKKFPYPGEYFDDALYRASEMDEALGRYGDAVADLERMLAALESSIWPGSYVRPRFPDAGWRIAVLYRDRIGDDKKAVAAFERYVGTFPNDIRRAEALWDAAKILRKDGDEPGACDRLARLVRIAPDSRYVPCAAARCPDVRVPKDSHAPKTCHAYITR
jgi:tetratricopeptide (TPR) repeat protein